tara:strand:- start:130 stop:408 length:279 start_codon:yes stop_codon:yes gene_type:complete
MKSLYGKRAKPMPTYTYNEEEFKWYSFCVKNNIRISPYGIQGDTEHWYIAISLGPYKKWEKPHLSPSKYCRKTIWPEYYKMCKYYYEKYNNK